MPRRSRTVTCVSTGVRWRTLSTRAAVKGIGSEDPAGPATEFLGVPVGLLKPRWPWSGAVRGDLPPRRAGRLRCRSDAVVRCSCLQGPRLCRRPANRRAIRSAQNEPPLNAISLKSREGGPPPRRRGRTTDRPDQSARDWPPCSPSSPSGLRPEASRLRVHRPSKGAVMTHSGESPP